MSQQTMADLLPCGYSNVHWMFKKLCFFVVVGLPLKETNSAVLVLVSLVFNWKTAGESLTGLTVNSDGLILRLFVALFHMSWHTLPSFTFKALEDKSKIDIQLKFILPCKFLISVKNSMEQLFHSLTEISYPDLSHSMYICNRFYTTPQALSFKSYRV